MVKAGWIEIKEDTPSEKFIDMYIEGFKKVTQYLTKLRTKKSAKRKNEDTSEVNQNKTPKESEAPSTGNSTRNVEQENLSLIPLEAPRIKETSLLVETTSLAIVADSASIAVLESIVQPQEKDLDKEVKKTSKSGLDGYIGIEDYFKFGVQFTQLIYVDQCNLAHEDYKCRPLSEVYVKFLLRQFAKHSRLILCHMIPLQKSL